MPCGLAECARGSAGRDCARGGRRTERRHQAQEADGGHPQVADVGVHQPARALQPRQARLSTAASQAPAGACGSARAAADGRGRPRSSIRCHWRACADVRPHAESIAEQRRASRARLHGRLEGDAAVGHHAARGAPARLDKCPPQDVVGDVGKPQRRDVLEAAHVVQHRVLRAEVRGQAHCARAWLGRRTRAAARRARGALGRAPPRARTRVPRPGSAARCRPACTAPRALP